MKKHKHYSVQISLLIILILTAQFWVSRNTELSTLSGCKQVLLLQLMLLPQLNTHFAGTLVLQI